jgi:hypothetical protein
MAVPASSTVTIRVGGVDISANAIWAETNYTVSAMAQPGTCRIGVSDPEASLSFTNGSIIEFLINGIRQWRGYLFDLEMGYVFQDDQRTRRWTLSGVDLNILLDKLVMYNHAHPTWYPDGGGSYHRRKVIEGGKTLGYQVIVPRYTMDDDYIRAMIDDFDLGLIQPKIRLDLDQVGMINPDGNFTPPAAGITLRDFLVDVSRNVQRGKPGSTVWYIDPDGYIVYREQDRYLAPFWVGDADPATVVGGKTGENVRNMTLSKGISSLKNDVLTFAGELDPRPTSKQTKLRYSHRLNQSSIDTYGRFQYSEVVGNSWSQGAVNARAKKIITQEGAPGWTATFTTFRNGLYPGQIIWVVSDAHNRTVNLPIRTITVSFAQPHIPQYQVSCSYDTQDPWGLLLALKRPPTRGLRHPDFRPLDLRRNPDQNSGPPARFTLVKEYPQSIGNRKYQCAYGYIRNSITVFVGKLRQVSMQDPLSGTVGFKETAPGKGQFQLADDPTGGKRVYVEYHVASKEE